MAEEDIPIDIHSAKLVYWLVDRKRVPSNWKESVTEITGEVHEAIQTLPSDVLGSVMTDEEYGDADNFHLFVCQRILEKLKEVEPEKNIFGQYQSARVKKWESICSMWKKNDIYLVHISSLLTRYMKYEIPHWKQLLSRMEQQIGDIKRRQTELKRHERESHRRHADMCEEIGVSSTARSSDELEVELRKSAVQLKSVSASVSSIIHSQDMRDAMDYYVAFVSFVSGSSIENIRKTILQRLFQILDEQEIEEEDMKEQEVKSSVEEEEKDVGVVWDVSEDANGDVEKSGDDMCWDINITESGEGQNNDENQLKTQERESEFIPPQWLDDVSYRSEVLDELAEFSAFLEQRREELQDYSDDYVQGAVMQKAPESLRRSDDLFRVSEFIKVVSEVQQELDGPRTQRLLLIRHSEKYVQRLATSLSNMLENGRRHMGRREQLQMRVDEFTVSSRSIRPRIEWLVEECRFFKEKVEEILPTFFNGRKVNIVGEVNSLAVR